MIDFSDVGTIVTHTINGEMCIELKPLVGKTVKDMLEVLDAGLEERGMERTILIQTKSSKRRGYPVPCVFLLDSNMP